MTRSKPGSQRRLGAPAAAASPPSGIAFARRAWVGPGHVFGIALAVRLFHVWSIRGAPFFDVLVGDARAYDAWAQRIAAGDWIGAEVFYQAPLYPYFLGALYAVAGRDLLLVRVCQAVVGAGSCVLVAAAGRRLFSARVGAVAGCALALYAPAIFFDGLIQKSVLDAFLVCLAIWLIARIVAPVREAPALSVTPWLALGLAMGALALTRENALVLVLVLLAWACIGQPGARGQRATRPVRARRAAALAVGVVALLAPVAVRNSVIGGRFYLTTAQLGPNLYIGNHAGADGTYQSLRYGRGAPEFERQDATELAEQALGRRLSPAEVSRYWSGRALEFVRAEPGAWLALMARKAALLANATEMIDTEDQAAYAEWSPPLRGLGRLGHFGVLLPLAALGVAVSWPERRRLAVLYVLVLVYAASVVVFYVFARYRFPLVPFLVLFASTGLVWVGEVAGAVARRRRQNPAAPAAFPAWPALVAVAATVVLANCPMGSLEGMRAVAETNLGVALQTDRRLEDAIAHYRRAIASRPDYAPAHNSLGAALRAQNQTEEAARSYRQALALEPGFADAHYNLGNLLLDRGDAAAAAGHFEQALRFGPASPAALNNLGIALVGSSRVDEAIAAFRRALELDPRSFRAEHNLGRALASKGEVEGAIGAFQRAVALDPAGVAARLDLGGALLGAGRLDDALAAYREAVERWPGLAEAHVGLGVALGTAGRLEEAIAEFRRALEIRPDFADAQRHLATAERYLASSRR